MFGNFGNIGKMMQLASEMKTRLPELQEKLERSEFTGQAGGGAVSATVSGKLQIISVKIDPQVVADGDVEMLEDLIKAAVSAAQGQAAQAAKEGMEEITGGMDLGPMGGLLGM